MRLIWAGSSACASSIITASVPSSAAARAAAAATFCSRAWRWNVISVNLVACGRVVSLLKPPPLVLRSLDAA